MTIGLLMYVFPTMFYTWQMFNPYYERQTIDRYGYDQERQALIDVARLKSGYDLDFMATVECESRRDRQSVGDGGDAKGLCQRNRRRNGYVLDDQRFSNRYWQVGQCLDYYRSVKESGIISNRLYGYNVREECATRFETGSVTLQEIKESELSS